MTEQELIKLSEEVAELYFISKFLFVYDSNGIGHKVNLYQDLARVMSLAIEHNLEIKCKTPINMDNHANKGYAIVGTNCLKQITEFYADHQTKEQAVIVAILKALEVLKGK